MRELHDQLFRELEPAAGGLQALRRRLGRERRSAALFWLPRTALATAALAAGLTVALWLHVPQAGDRVDLTARFHPSLAAMGIVDAPPEPLRIAAGSRHLMAAKRIPTDNDRVVLYLVASLDSPESASGE